MRALKILVVVMGVLLVGGTAALVAMVIARVERRPAAAAAPAPASPLRTVLAQARRIVAATLSGDRVLVRVERADGGEELVLFDARNGAEIAVIELPAAASGGTMPSPPGAEDHSGGDPGHR